MLDIMRQNASGWIVKLLFGIIIVVFVFAFGMSGFDDNGDPVLAYVDDTPLTRKEFERAYGQVIENLRKSRPDMDADALQNPAIKQFVLNDLVNRVVLLQEAKKLGIEASATEIATAISRQPAFWNAEKKFDRDAYLRALSSNHMSPATFERDYANQLVLGKLQQLVDGAAQATPAQARELYDWVRMQARAKYLIINAEQFLDSVEISDEKVKEYYDKNIDKFTAPATAEFRYIAFTPVALAPFQTVTDDEIKAYYDANKDDFSVPEQVKARHILIRLDPKASEVDMKTAEKKFAKLQERLAKGEDFAEVAKTASEGPSAPMGGELGWFGRNSMVKPFEDAAFAMKKGEYSKKPVRTQFGLHIIKLEDHRDAHVRPLAEVSTSIKDDIAAEKAAEKVSDLLDQAMDRLVSGMKLDKIAEELKLVAIKGQPVAQQTLQYSMGMTPDAAEMMFALPVGEHLKTPLAVRDGYIIGEKIGETPATPVDLEKVKPTIVASLKSQEATRLSEEKAAAILKDIKEKGAEEALKPYEKQIRTTDAFTRRGPIPGLGQNPEMIKALFNDLDMQWIDQSFATPIGSAIVKLDETIPADGKLWAQEKDAWMQSVNRTFSEDLFKVFMTTLRSGATVDVTRPDLLN